MFEIPVQITIAPGDDLWDKLAVAAAFAQALLTIAAMLWTTRETRRQFQREDKKDADRKWAFVRAVSKAVSKAKEGIAGILILDMDSLHPETVQDRLGDVPAGWNGALAGALATPIHDWPSPAFYVAAERMAYALDAYHRACQAYTQQQGFREIVDLRLAHMNLQQIEQAFHLASVTP